MASCHICHKRCKGEFGVKIHVARMHAVGDISGAAEKKPMVTCPKCGGKFRGLHGVRTHQFRNPNCGEDPEEETEDEEEEMVLPEEEAADVRHVPEILRNIRANVLAGVKCIERIHLDLADLAEMFDYKLQ